MTKRELRTLMKQRLAALPREQYTGEGKAAARILAASTLWQSFERVLIYLSMPDELDTQPLFALAFQQGKHVYAPKVESETTMRFFRVTERDDESTWVSGAFGIREPAGHEDAVFVPEAGPALVVSPGLAFDSAGRRLGRGKGYYDRFYEQLFSASPESAVCAFALSCALVDEVPVEPFDRSVNAICTKDGFFEITPVNQLKR